MPFKLCMRNNKYSQSSADLLKQIRIIVRRLEKLQGISSTAENSYSHKDFTIENDIEGHNVITNIDATEINMHGKSRKNSDDEHEVDLSELNRIALSNDIEGDNVVTNVKAKEINSNRKSNDVAKRNERRIERREKILAQLTLAENSAKKLDTFMTKNELEILKDEITEHVRAAKNIMWNMRHDYSKRERNFNRKINKNIKMIFEICEQIEDGSDLDTMKPELLQEIQWAILHQTRIVGISKWKNPKYSGIILKKLRNSV